MNRIIKIFLLLIISLNLISCDEKFEENYPKTVSQLDGFWSTNSRYEIDINDFNEFPERIQSLAKNYLIGKMGKQRFSESNYTYGYIASNKPINNKNNENEIVALLNGEDSKENNELDTKYNYPVYSIGFEYSDLTKGIKKYDLTLIVDNNGEILKHANFPKTDLKNLNFVSIDSVHRVLSKRKITSKKLELDLRFNRKDKSLFYYARTLVRAGSVAGPSCFPEYQEHFKVNALTGEIVEFDNENWTEYYNN